MKNNTKVRLHLSKQLFESLTKQVLAEAKSDMSGGAYTEAVKAPKASKGGEAPKADKASKQSKAPEKKTAKKESIHNHPSMGRITDNPQTNVKNTGGSYDPKKWADRLKALQDFGPKDTKQTTKQSPKLKEMEIPAGFEQAAAELVDFLKTNGAFLAGVGGITGVAKLIANQLKNDPEARKNLDAITGAGSTKRDF